MTFTINEKQMIKLIDWKEAINKVFGEYGTYEYRFTENKEGGFTVTVYNNLAKISLEL